MMTSASFYSVEEKEIISKQDGHAGVMMLNRPKALNALSLSMIREITRLLVSWKDDTQIHCVMLMSTHDKAFCAGGDIRSVYDARLKGDEDYICSIFQEEYLLNYMIQMFPKPYISFIDGLSMGGGLGISIHGSHRLVTEKTGMAMPETAIGFFPDIGANFFLNRCPGEIGTYLALLGSTIAAEDCLYAGLATHRLASQEMMQTYQELTCTKSIDEMNDVLQNYAGGQSDCFLQNYRNLIDECFSFNTVEEIMEALFDAKNPVADQWLEELEKKSPTSLKLALALLRHTKGRTLKEVLTLDFQVSQHCAEGHDFYEGIRALLIDKDKNPRWNPARLEDVTPQAIEKYFQPRK
ncbi:MAG: enoyl-CoA hydratase/isomerase family protein [Alphaproteobacteria bacterium]|nr:enoyl-CoA hydratase/isomerase family protein [Alphaproteobacteria bacterium]